MVAPEEAAVAGHPHQYQVPQEMFLTQVQALQDYKATTEEPETVRVPVCVVWPWRRFLLISESFIVRVCRSSGWRLSNRAMRMLSMLRKE